MSKVLIEVLVIILIAGSYLILYSAVRVSAISDQRIAEIIEIEAIDIRYPVLEGAGNSQIRYAIGHMTETAGLGKKGNCVLCGHNGSRSPYV